MPSTSTDRFTQTHLEKRLGTLPVTHAPAGSDSSRPASAPDVYPMLGSPAAVWGGVRFLGVVLPPLLRLPAGVLLTSYN